MCSGQVSGLSSRLFSSSSIRITCVTKYVSLRSKIFLKKATTCYGLRKQNLHLQHVLRECSRTEKKERKKERNKQTNKQITTTTSKLLIKPQLSVDKRPTVRRLSSVTRLLADGSVRSAENDLHSTDRFVSVLFFNFLKVTPDLSRMSSRVLLEKLSMRNI